MYYNRTLSDDFSGLIEKGGSLRWLYDYVKQNKELDFLIGRNNNKEWISVYRGLSRVLTITKSGKKDNIVLDAAKAYKKLNRDFYGVKSCAIDFSKKFTKLISDVANNNKFDRYYKNEKEGYFQNILSRRYGICGKGNDDFVIIDKEAVIGYSDNTEKNNVFGTEQKEYKSLQRIISETNPHRFGKNLEKKSIGNELDFLALDKKGNILLIEYKHGTNTSGIYLSPLQIGMYYDLFTALSRKNLDDAINQMLSQKQRIGLINPKWVVPTLKNIVPVLIISEYNYKSSARAKYEDVLTITRNKLGDSFLSNIKTYNFTLDNGLTNW